MESVSKIFTTPLYYQYISTCAYVKTVSRRVGTSPILYIQEHMLIYNFILAFFIELWWNK